MNISSFIPSWFNSTSSSAATTTVTTDSVDLSSGLDSMFGQVIENALEKVSGEGNTTAVTASSDSMSLLGAGLADGLLTSFYQSKISNSLTPAPEQAVTANTTATPAKAGVTVGTVKTSDTNDDGVLQPFADGQQLSFSDIVDVVNPLQHIPLINYYYRDLTGDEIGFVPQLVGSTIYGGTLGAIGSLVEMGASSLLGESPVKYALNAVSSDSDS